MSTWAWFLLISGALSLLAAVLAGRRAAPQPPAAYDSAAGAPDDEDPIEKRPSEDDDGRPGDDIEHRHCDPHDPMSLCHASHPHHRSCETDSSCNPLDSAFPCHIDTSLTDTDDTLTDDFSSIDAFGGMTDTGFYDDDRF